MLEAWSWSLIFLFNSCHTMWSNEIKMSAELWALLTYIRHTTLFCNFNIKNSYKIFLINNWKNKHFLVSKWKLLNIYMQFFFLQGEWEKQPIPVVTSTLEKHRYPCEGGAVPTSWPVYAGRSGVSLKDGALRKLNKSLWCGSLPLYFMSSDCQSSLVFAVIKTSVNIHLISLEQFFFEKGNYYETKSKIKPYLREKHK